MEKTKKEEVASKNKYFIILIFILFLAIIILVPSQLIRKDAFVVVKSAQKEDLDAYIGTTEKNNLNEEKLTYDIENESCETTVTISENGKGAAEVVFPLDINSATVDELLMVTGIGEKTAQNIVNYRKLHGYFFSMDELLNVEGIGEKKLEYFKDYLYIDYEILPETSAPIFISDEAAENTASTGIVTAVPYNDSLETTETVVAVDETEDFVMEIEEFVTDEDYDDFDDDYTDYDDYTETTSAETEYTPNFPLDLNTASVSDLTYINGIGESTAKSIVEYAEKVGFTSVDDLLNVNGIGKNKLEMIRPYVYVDSNYTVETNSETEYTPNFPLDLNTASVSDLTYINGIGESTAKSIVEYAEKVGFTSVDDLLNVRGIGKSKLEMIRPYVYVDSNYTVETNSETEESPIIPLELNTASVSELMKINGIGEATAKKIVEYAQKVGFTSVDDLLNVSGIGKSKLEMIRPYVYVDLNYFTGTFPETENTDTESSQPAEIYKVDMNNATIEGLMQLPGIDEQTAEAILYELNSLGPFKNHEELEILVWLGIITKAQYDEIYPYFYV